MPPPQSFGAPNIQGQTVAELADSTQFWLQRIYNHLDTLAGLRGTPTFFSDVDLNGKTLKNLSNPLDPQDALPASQALRLQPNPQGMQFDAQGIQIANLPMGDHQTDAVNVEQLQQSVSGLSSAKPATNPPPAVADASVLGTIPERFAREDHTHRGVDYDAGTFTITATGMTASVTGTARWEKHRNIVVLWVPDLSGTSNATTFTLTGLPAAITPTLGAYLAGFFIQDNGVFGSGVVVFVAASTTITLYPNIAFGAWTAAGTKAFRTTMIVYALL